MASVREQFDRLGTTIPANLNWYGWPMGAGTEMRVRFGWTFEQALTHAQSCCPLDRIEDLMPTVLSVKKSIRDGFDVSPKAYDDNARRRFREACSAARPDLTAEQQGDIAARFENEKTRAG